MGSDFAELEKVNPVRLLARIRGWIRLRQEVLAAQSQAASDIGEFQKLIFSTNGFADADWTLIGRVITATKAPMEYLATGDASAIALPKRLLLKAYELAHEFVIGKELPINLAGGFFEYLFREIEEQSKSDDLAVFRKQLPQTVREVGRLYDAWKRVRDGRRSH